MFLYLTLNNPKRETEFNKIPRCNKLKQSFYTEQILNRFCQVESRWGYSGTSDRIRFSVDKNIFIIGVGLYGSIYGKCEYQALIQVILF
jgi:BTB/POZ domain-containing protein 1/2